MSGFDELVGDLDDAVEEELLDPGWHLPAGVDGAAVPVQMAVDLPRMIDRLEAAAFNLADSLRAMADRSTAPTEAEWETRCGKGVERILAAVRAALPTGVSAFALFRLIDVRVSTHEDLAADFRRLELGTASPLPDALQSNLRDLVGGASRRRGAFRAPALRRTLQDDFGADLFEPREWGLGAYRETLGRSLRIEIPGRGISAPVEKVVVWPKARLQTATPERDFEDELPRWNADQPKGDVEIRSFPAEGLQQCILIAGPGFGKSTLIKALSAQLLETPITPVEISLGAFAEVDMAVVEFLEAKVNRDYSVRVDWLRLAARLGVVIMPADLAAASTPAAISSLEPKIAVGGSRRASRRRAPRKPSSKV